MSQEFGVQSIWINHVIKYVTREQLVQVVRNGFVLFIFKFSKRIKRTACTQGVCVR